MKKSALVLLVSLCLLLPSPSLGQTQKTSIEKSSKPKVTSVDRPSGLSPSSKSGSLKAPTAEESSDSNQAKTESKPSHDSLPFILKGEQLSANYLGHDIKEIYKILQERNAPKGEFETTAAYESRLANNTNLPLKSGLPLQSTLAFRVDYEAQHLEYDADRQTMKFIIPVENKDKYAFNSKKEDEINTQIESVKTVDRTFAASNSYGARATVEVATFDLYNLRFTNLRNFVNKFESTFYELKYRIPIEKAKAAKENFSLLYVTNLVSPFVDYKKGYGAETTLSSPYRYTFNYNYVVGEVKEIIIFNRATGEIYGRLTKFDN
jgi:hypothetical protein